MADRDGSGGSKPSHLASSSHPLSQLLLRRRAIHHHIDVLLLNMCCFVIGFCDGAWAGPKSFTSRVLSSVGRSNASNLKGFGRTRTSIIILSINNQPGTARRFQWSKEMSQSTDAIILWWWIRNDTNNDEKATINSRRRNDTSYDKKQQSTQEDAIISVFKNRG